MSSSRMVSVHSSSMQSSRDPAGLDPSGIDVVAGADPPPDEYRDNKFETDPPILPPHTVSSGPPPPTPRRNPGLQHGIQAPSPVMAFLVGEPPPPPPTPPPHKHPTRRHNVPVSPPGDASTTTGFSSLSSSIHPRRDPPREPIPREPLMDVNPVSYVDQKRREALAIYESPNLYMDSQQDDREQMPQKFESMIPHPKHEVMPYEQQTRQQMPQTNDKRVSTGPIDLDDDPFDPIMNSLASPRSAVTEPHSNKRNAMRRNSRRASSQESLDNQSSSGSQSSSDKSSSNNNPKKAILGNGNPAKKRRGRMSTGSTKVPKMTSEKRGRGRSVETVEKRGRGRSMERGNRAETPERKKKGFFGKIFGGGKRNAKSSKAEESTPVKTKVAGATPAKSATAPVANARPEDLPVLPPHKPTPVPPTMSAPLEEYNAHGANFEQSGVPNVGSKAVSTPLDLGFQPHEKPTQLNTAPNDEATELELGMGLDSVTSGLTNDMEPDRRDIFFAHDEVSTLTAPSAHSYSRRSVDPIEATGTVTSGLSSEPVGHYWNTGVANKVPTTNATPKVAIASPVIDPFTEPFFREPDGESPITSSKTNKAKSKLQVDVPHTKDPVGETPPTKHSATHMNEPSPRGWESPVTELKDPLGSTISESASKRAVPGFSRPESASKPKIPPSQKATPQDARREPSAVRDGSPYALDPPLRGHEGEPKEGVKESKNLVGILTKASRSEASAPEGPPSAAREEVQPPPTPSTVQSEQAQKENTENQANVVRPEEDIAPALTKNVNKSPLIKKAVVGTPARSPEKVKVNSAKKVELDSPDATGFLDDLFQEKPSARKRPSIVRPISINVSESPNRSTVKSSSQTQVIEIHRTQRLSGSPRSNKAAPWNASSAATAEPGEIKPLPVPVRAPGSPKNEVVSPPRASRLQRNIREEGEEKKEQENGKLFSSVEETSSNSMLATSTAALSTAACMNAKTVAYLHTLNGEPSPRHAWRRADLSDDDYSPIKSDAQRKAVSNVKAAMAKTRALSVNSDEVAFDSFISSSPVKAPPSTKGRGTGPVNGFGKTDQPSTRAGSASARSSSTSRVVASMMSNKQPRKKQIAPTTKSKPKPKIQQRSRYGAHSPKSRKTARENFRRPLYLFRFNRDVRVTGAPLVFGLDLIRKKRIDNILNGYALPVYKDKSVKSKKTPPPPFQCLEEVEIKDPIQRAGRRLLSKAAVPIQSAARRYLARREALTRAQANIVLQSYFRRWQCEAFLIAYRFTCIKIQAGIRSWLVRNEIAYEHYQATQIQRVVRGYIAAAYVYDTIYWVAKVQAAMRGKLARVHYANLKDLRQKSAVRCQAWFRGCVVRREATERREATCAIQSVYRSYRARIMYQMHIVDIIIAQSVVRQFLAGKETERRRLVKMNAAACKIQATWRGFQGYTDYIFALVDILVLQRSMRKWLAQKQVNSMRRERAAIKIQAQWRRQTALIGMLYDLVHIIIAQSVARRFLARKKVPRLRMEYSKKMEHQQMLDTAATKIQTAWRGFWGYSHFIIMQYEIIRLQAIIRGRASRILFSLKLGCCIMMQSAVRRYLASKKTYKMKLAAATLGAEVEGLRMKSACRRVQFWWRVVMECAKEKKAALVIERFFLMVKAEVDKEIIRQREIQAKEMQREREMQIRKQRSKLSTQSAPAQPTQLRRRVSSDAADEKLLERVWLNTVEEDKVEVLAYSKSQDRDAASKTNNKATPKGGNKRGEDTRRSKSAPRLHQNPSYVSEPSKEPNPSLVKHHPSSPTMNLVMRHEEDPAMRRELELRARKEEALKASRRIQQKSNKPPHDVMLSRTASELSAITSPTVFTGGTTRSTPKKSARKSTKSLKEPQGRKKSNAWEDDVSLEEESLLGEGIVEAAKSQGMQSIHSAPHKKGPKKNHFFSEEPTNSSKPHPSHQGRQANRRHSTSSIASEISYTLSDDISDMKSHLYPSRKSTATTITRTTASRSVSLGSPQSKCDTDVDMRKTVNQNLSSPLVDRKYSYGADKYTTTTTTASAATKGKKLIETVRGGSGLSPRHGQIVVTNVPILSQDSRDNVEIELNGGGEQFGLI